MPDLTLARIGDGGRVCLFGAAPTQLVIDVTGYVPAGSALAPLTPARLLDTRVGSPTVDGRAAGTGKVRGGVSQVLTGGRPGWGGRHVRRVPHRHRHDFGSNPSYGIPFTVVGPGEAPVPMAFVGYPAESDVGYPAESDPGPYPMPLDTPVEAGGDRHAIALQQESCTLYEAYDATPTPTGWRASNGVRFDLRSNARRTDGYGQRDGGQPPVRAITSAATSDQWPRVARSRRQSANVKYRTTRSAKPA